MSSAALYQVLITASAKADLRDAARYIAGDSRPRARQWLLQIKGKVLSLKNCPERGAVIQESEYLGREYRHLIHGNYRIIYRIDGRRVVVLRVLHAARLLREL